jgi:hypothetical protein
VKYCLGPKQCKICVYGNKDFLFLREIMVRKNRPYRTDHLAEPAVGTALRVYHHKIFAVTESVLRAYFNAFRKFASYARLRDDVRQDKTYLLALNPAELKNMFGFR